LVELAFTGPPRNNPIRRQDDQAISQSITAEFSSAHGSLADLPLLTKLHT
jgi:hypothetical protein